MKTEINKLKKLAEHLSLSNLHRPFEELMENLKQDDRGHGHYYCFPFVFNEMPFLFDEWEH